MCVQFCWLGALETLLFCHQGLGEPMPGSQTCGYPYLPVRVLHFHNDTRPRGKNMAIGLHCLRTEIRDDIPSTNLNQPRV